MKIDKQLFKEAFIAGYKKAKRSLNEGTEEAANSASKFDELRRLVHSVSSTKSAWSRGVAEYAERMIDNLEEHEEWDPGFIDSINVQTPGWSKKLQKVLLDGAQDWKESSWGGSWEIYDQDIAKTLCSPWELKKTDNGRKRPNAREEWLDVQARALYQAAMRVEQAFKQLG